MNHYWKSILRLLTILVLFSTFYLTGCSEDNPVEVGSSSLDSLLIISNPVSPKPGETAVLSVRIIGNSTGAWPSYQWTVGEGTLNTDNESVVEWTVPDETGDYLVSLTVTLDTRSLSTEKTVSARYYEIIDTGRRYNLHPRLKDSELFFVTPYQPDISFNDPFYINTVVMKYTGPGQNEVITDDVFPFDRRERGGDSWFFTEDGEKVIGSMINDYSINNNQQHKNIAAYYLSGSGGFTITNSLSGVGSKRRYNQYRTPFANYNGSMVVMQYVKAGQNLDGTKDFLNISMWKPGYPSIPDVLTKSADSTFIVAGEDTIWLVDYYENMLPLLTPDDGNIIYFSNRSGIFEPCMIPLPGGEPDTANAKYLDVFSNRSIRISRSTVFEWQPGGNRAAFIGSVSRVNTLCFLEYQAASDTITFDVTDVPDVSEFVWSPDGTKGAVITDLGVYIVTSMGEILTEVLSKEHPNDQLYGINWAPDPADPQIGFRLARPGKDWTESFNAVMVYSEDNDILSYVTKAYDWPDNLEPGEVDYRWKRIVFSPDGNDIYAPLVIGTMDPGGGGLDPLYGSIQIVHSWK